MERHEELRRKYLGFYKAARRQDLDRMVELIRETPAVIECEGSAGTLIEIVDREAPDYLEPVLVAGLKPDVDSEPRAITLLQSAAAEGNIHRLRLLIKYGADAERRNDTGEVALGYACSWGQLAAVEVLVESGADVNVIEEDPETGYRNTPLDCTHQYPEIAKYLRSKGAKHLSEIEA